MKSTKDAKKAEKERLIFRAFLMERGENRGEIISRNYPEPDILYEGKIAFELMELCSPEIAREVARLSKVNGESDYIRCDDSYRNILKGKLHKSYQSEHPVELLMYTAGRIIAPDDVLVSQLMPVIECSTFKFEKIWLWGDEVHLLYPYNK